MAEKDTPQESLTPQAVSTSEPSTTEEEDLEAQLAYEKIKQERQARKRRRTIIIIAIAIVALVIIIWFVAGQANQETESTEIDPLTLTSTVYRDDFEDNITANGATVPATTTVVTPEVDGIIENVQVAEGDNVKEGDVLFTIKNDDLDKEVRSAQLEVEKCEREVGSANAAVNDAIAAYDNAWNACNAADDWSDFDEAGLNSAISSAEDGYANAVSSLNEARETLSEKQANAEKRTVRAPASGAIVAMNAVEGASTTSTGAEGGTSSLVEIADLSTMKVTVEVNEVDIINVAEGQKATVTFAALKDVELEATVERIASKSSGSGSGDEGLYGGGGVVTYAVTLVIPKPDPNLKPGMTATVTITTQSAPNSLIIPASSLNSDEAETTVTVLVDEETGETREAAVTVIAKNSSEAAVKSDELKEGDLVIMGGGSSGLDLELGEEELDSIGIG